MHAGRCREPNATRTTPTAFVHYWCQCQSAKLMGQPDTCCMSDCKNPTRVLEGKPTSTCESCYQKEEALIARGLAIFDARRALRLRGRR